MLQKDDQSQQPKEPRLEIQHLYKSMATGRHTWFNSGRQTEILSDINLTLESGKVLGIIGESGSGKSTLARLICGLDSPNRGEILIDGQPLPSYRRDRHRLVQLVFQNSQAAMNPRKTIQQILAAPTKYLAGLTGSTQQERMTQLLDQVGLSADYLHRRPHELSGGQAQRIGIARALAGDPKLLVLDEPTSALDVSIQAQILDLLKQLQQQHQLTMIFISHDLAVVEKICDQGVVLQSGQVVEIGSIDHLFQHPQCTYTQTLIEAVKAQAFIT